MFEELPKHRKLYLTKEKLLSLINSPPVDKKWNDQIVHTSPFLELFHGCPCCYCKHNDDCETLAQVMLPQYDANTRAMVYSCGMGDWYERDEEKSFEVILEEE